MVPITDEDVTAISLYSSPDFSTPRNAHLVREVLYSDTAHNFGDDTETGVAKVTMLIDEVSVFGIGQERDHTGMDSVAVAVEVLVSRLTAAAAAWTSLVPYLSLDKIADEKLVYILHYMRLL